MNSQPTDHNARAPIDLDPQLVLTDWIRATQEFYQWYCQLDQFVQQPGLSSYPSTTDWLQKSVCHSSAEIRQLQRDLRVMLAALQNDMRQVDNQQGASSKFDRLIGHTSTMLYWSKQIQWALGIKPTALC